MRSARAKKLADWIARALIAMGVLWAMGKVIEWAGR